jgi:hypothetical protein
VLDPRSPPGFIGSSVILFLFSILEPFLSLFLSLTVSTFTFAFASPFHCNFLIPGSNKYFGPAFPELSTRILRPGAMSSPVEDRKTFLQDPKNKQKDSDISPTSDDGTYVTEPDTEREIGRDIGRDGGLKVDTSYLPEDDEYAPMRTPSARREQATRLEDDLMLLQAERMTSRSTHEADDEHDRNSINRARSRRSEQVDEFDEATNPLHEKAAIYKPPEKPNTQIAVFVKKLHQSSFLVRYVTYISPLVILLLIPLLVGALVFPNASVGGVQLMWFSIWLEIVWLTLWAGRVSSRNQSGSRLLLICLFD